MIEIVAEHGTTRGYQRHLRLKTAPCDACKGAETARKRAERTIHRAERQRQVEERKKKIVEDAERRLQVNRAQNLALRRLAAENPGRILELCGEELRRMAR